MTYKRKQNTVFYLPGALALTATTTSYSFGLKMILSENGQHVLPVPLLDLEEVCFLHFPPPPPVFCLLVGLLFARQWPQRVEQSSWER